MIMPTIMLAMLLKSNIFVTLKTSNYAKIITSKIDAGNATRKIVNYPKNRGPLCPLHSHFVLFFIFLVSKRSGQRKPPAERSALYILHIYYIYMYIRAIKTLSNNGQMICMLSLIHI